MAASKKGKAADKPDAKSKSKAEDTPGPVRTEQPGPIHPDDQPPQAGGGVTGPENIARQQQDPELDDTSGSHA